MARNPGRLSVGRVLLIAGITGAGALVLVAGLIVMNRTTHEPEEDEVGPAVSFTVPPPPEPQPRERQRPQSRQLRRSNQPTLAPLPNLGASLSGLEVSLPQFQAEASVEVNESVLGDVDDVALTEDTVDQPPAYRSRSVPEYPQRARQREIEGRVLVSALIGVDGRVKAVQILESTPPGVFDDAVKAALQSSTFDPATYKGNPVETWVEIPFPFRLN